MMRRLLEWGEGNKTTVANFLPYVNGDIERKQVTWYSHPRTNNQKDIVMNPENSTRPGRWRRFEIWYSTTLLLLYLLCLHFICSQSFDAPVLFGDRTEAIFDLWSLQHFCSGVLIGSFFLLRPLRPTEEWPVFFFRARISTLFVLAIVWETAEVMMEAGFFGSAISHWKHGFEHWGNRFIGDPLMVVLGGVFAEKFPNAWKWGLAFAVVWLVVNVASPHSMAVQEWLFGP